MTAPSPTNTEPTSSEPKANLERFLCGDLEAIPALEVLRSRRLEAWAYTVLPTGHPLKAICKTAFIAARARHELIKNEVLEMVRAWNAVGIEPVIYKGFALAEFAYDIPGTRFHGDVDVLVQPADFRRALEVGHQHGWTTPPALDHWLFENPNPHELSLKRKRAHAAFDVHQRLVPTTTQRDTRREHELTQAAWANAQPTEWHGSRIRLLRPEDAFIYGLVISRCWSGDGWRLKSHDLLDGLALKRQGATREAVLHRAITLNVAHTVNAFLDRCDPFTPALELKNPTPFTILKLELGAMGEHTPLLFGRFRNLIFSLPDIAMALEAFPLWLEVNRTLKQHPDIERALKTLEQVQHNTKAIRHTSLIWWLARRFKQSSSLVWPVMVYIALHRNGRAANFKLGERNGQRRGWVELDAKPLPEFEIDPGSLESFNVVLERNPARTPAEATAHEAMIPRE
jgi:Uncharacterised nucleotidyltransferase